MAKPVASISVRTPFGEAIQQAQERGITLPDEYYGMLPIQARSQAFTVSGLAAMDQIQRVLDSLVQALNVGQTFEQWKEEALANIGELATLPNGRMETIFRNAIQTSYGAGRWAQFQRAKSRRPYLMYDAINDSRTRDSHRAMDGFIAPVDDPVWDRWAPPNGHNCRCSLRALTEEEAKRRGWMGQTRPAPAEPDDGWDYNPAYDQRKAIAEVIRDRMGKIDDVALSKAEQLEYAARLDGEMPAPRPLVLNPITNEAEAFEALLRELESTDGVIELEGLGRAVTNKEAIQDVEQWILYIANTIRSPQQVWLQSTSASQALHFFANYDRGGEIIYTYAQFIREEGDDYWLLKYAKDLDEDEFQNESFDVAMKSVIKSINP